MTFTTRPEIAGTFGVVATTPEDPTRDRASARRPSPTWRAGRPLTAVEVPRSAPPVLGSWAPSARHGVMSGAPVFAGLADLHQHRPRFGQGATLQEAAYDVQDRGEVGFR